MSVVVVATNPMLGLALAPALPKFGEAIYWMQVIKHMGNTNHEGDVGNTQNQATRTAEVE